MSNEKGQTFPQWHDQVTKLLIDEGSFSSLDEAIHELANYGDELQEMFDSNYSPQEAANSMAY